MSDSMSRPLAGKLDIAMLFANARVLSCRAFQQEALVHLQEVVRFDIGMISIWHANSFIAAVVHGHDRTSVLPSWRRTAGPNGDRLFEKALENPKQAIAINWDNPLMHSEQAKQWREEFLGRMGLHHVLGVNVPMEGMAGSMFIGLGRASLDDPFLPQDIECLTEGAPHLMGAWVINRIGAGATLNLSDANATPTAITLPDGWILLCNTAFADAWATLSVLDTRIEAPRVPHEWFAKDVSQNDLNAIFRPHGWSLWTEEKDDGYRVELRMVAPESPIVKLTAREREVSRLYSRGYSYKDIGRVLTVAPNTVRVHLHRIFDKLNIASRSELRDLFESIANGSMGAADNPSA
ncbi:helix-turn-helix transcriptional regulator [Trinickia sp. YCB016]